MISFSTKKADRDCAIFFMHNIHVSNLNCVNNTVHTEPAPAGARGSQNCAILSILCPFSENRAFLCVNDVVVDLPCGKDTTKVFFFSKLTQINTLSIQLWRLLTLDSKIPDWIRLKIVRKGTNNSQSTIADVRVAARWQPSFGTKAWWRESCHKIF